MKDKQLYLYWLYLFIICAALGFIQDRNPIGVALLTIVGIAFFAPPAVLVYRDIHAGTRKHLGRIAILSLCSLVATMVLFIVYWLTLTVSASDIAANIAYAALTILSVPMMCVAFPAVSMFLWACLLIVSVVYWKKQKTTK
jgi:hypothetical protein